MSEANNYVCFNVDQSGNHSEPTRLRARNNIGAAALSSLAASFESRAPNYVWNAGEVCTYGGKLWMFDSNHSGAWAGADAHETNLDKLMLFDDITEQIEFYNNVIVKNKKVLFNPYLKQLKINVSCYKTTSMSGDVNFFKLPTGLSYVGEFCSPFCQALNNDGGSNTNIAMYLIGTDGGRIKLVGRSITGTNYGIALRVILDFKRNI